MNEELHCPCGAAINTEVELKVRAWLGTVIIDSNGKEQDNDTSDCVDIAVTYTCNSCGCSWASLSALFYLWLSQAERKNATVQELLTQQEGVNDGQG